MKHAQRLLRKISICLPPFAQSRTTLVMSQIYRTDIAAAVLSAIFNGDTPLSDVTIGSHLLAVRGTADGGAAASHIGMASRVDHLGHHNNAVAGDTKLPNTPITLGELAHLLTDPPENVPALGLEANDPLLTSSLALAAVNALLPTPPAAAPKKGQDLILEKGQGKRVVVVGHFPFVERLAGEFASFDVLERNPKPGDLPAAEAERIMPLADVAAITSTTISNGTLAGLLTLCRKDCFVVLLGPSTPFAPGLFDLGVDALAGATVTAQSKVLDGILDGRPFKGLDGVQSLMWLRD